MPRELTTGTRELERGDPRRRASSGSRPIRPALGRTAEPPGGRSPPARSPPGARRRARRRAAARQRHAVGDPDRPSALPRVHPAAPHAGLRARRRAAGRRTRSTAGRGSRARAPSTPRTRRCAGSRTSPGCPAARAAASSRAAPPATCRRSHAAREHARPRRDGPAPHRWRGRVSASEAHSSVRTMLRVMDAERSRAPTSGRLTGAALREALDADGADGVFAVVATAGTTNVGLVDDLAGVAAVAASAGCGCTSTAPTAAPALCAPSVRGTVRRDRARRLVHRRPAQVAVRAVRLVRAALPRPGARPRRAPPARVLPRGARTPMTA